MSRGSLNSCGVVVLMKKGVEVIVHSKIVDPQGRFIVLKIEFNDNLCLDQRVCSEQRQRQRQIS